MKVILDYFSSDPLRILYFLGGAGGVWYWIEKWLDRVRLRVRVLDHSFDPQNQQLEVRLAIEVVNLGKTTTSLEPHLICVGYDVNRRRHSQKLQIENDERQLPPHSTRQFIAEGNLDARYPFWLFKTYRIPPTRGWDEIIYTRARPEERISRMRYEIELTLYRWTGVIFK